MRCRNLIKPLSGWYFIGDIGIWVSDEADPMGYKVDDVAKLLKENNCDFYVIHLGGEECRRRLKFETETKVISRLAEGTAICIFSGTATD